MKPEVPYILRLPFSKAETKFRRPSLHSWVRQQSTARLTHSPFPSLKIITSPHPPTARQRSLSSMKSYEKFSPLKRRITPLPRRKASKSPRKLEPCDGQVLLKSKSIMLRWAKKLEPTVVAKNVVGPNLQSSLKGRSVSCPRLRKIKVVLPHSEDDSAYVTERGLTARYVV
mmetsp:Transcript_6662/g.11770  ORF Transcript_6662/g.11770 Transcript_6662/m.11770 type:complete len:171 (-) Transcript_6662:4938-5450(-)